MTVNNEYEVNRHMMNRPGRIYYRMSYTGLDETFIRDYCADNLNAKGETDGLVRLTGLFQEFNFDMLSALVEEMNRYGETAVRALEYLNCRPETDGASRYDVTLTVNGKAPEHGFRPTGWQGNPIGPVAQSGITIWTLDEEDDVRDSHSFYPGDLVAVDRDAGTFVLQRGPVQLTLTRKKLKPLSLVEFGALPSRIDY